MNIKNTVESKDFTKKTNCFMNFNTIFSILYFSIKRIPTQILFIQKSGNKNILGINGVLLLIFCYSL